MSRQNNTTPTISEYEEAIGSPATYQHDKLVIKPRRDSSSHPAGASPSIRLSKAIDFDGLSWPARGTKERLNESAEAKEARLQKMSGAIRTVLECLGEDPEREGLLDTPMRYAKAMMYFTQGYTEDLRSVLNSAVFEEDHNEMVIVRDIEVFSMCEHHLCPWFGKMSIGYIPNKRVIGLSKLARIADMFARRLQVQERFSKQVAQALLEVLQPKGVAVVVEASHMCMTMRGVQKTSATTVTSCMLGCFEKSQKTREEFLSLALRR
ncbi:GTP cyclohydrolase I (GTP-CH-I) [Protomyces lactucae-debilis]|uniref:GTP cyclohydrolase 1 n=1 Tax=Protomyces lactucae-debilis TaxID=2754530 RepID=A0A1Y2F3M7_PROLT|nr:GTP cyclohydrolase I (GTP-CH-I) [Protomyces lactucae-debilis]ORY78508.1 GTP cyclohydrolase I (GTP-CH-I) [Protomyces lactucae-debilis]